MKFTLSRLASILPLCAGLAMAACGADDTTPEPEICEGDTCLCSSDEDCPEGQQCVSLTCQLAADAAADTGPDATPDATPDVPTDIQGDGVTDTQIIPGACTNDRDNEIIVEDNEAFDSCSQECAAASEVDTCTIACLEGLGLSEECAACGGEWMLCIEVACPMCAELIDEACTECVNGATECEAQYIGCAGDRPIVDDPVLPLEPGCNEEDQAAIAPPKDWFQAGVDCAIECDGQEPPCLRDCISTALSTSLECGLCFVEQRTCAEVVCEELCVDPESLECTDCRNGACVESLEECVGIDLYEEPDQVFSRLRLVHLSPGLGGINGYMTEADADFALNIQFGNASDSTERIPVFGTALDVRASSEGLAGDVLFAVESENPLAPNQVYSMVVYGPAEDGAAWLVSQNLGERPSGSAVQFYNASVSLGQVDVYYTRGGERQDLESNINYGRSTPQIALEPASYLILVDIDDDGEIDYEFGLGALEIGSEVSLFLFDDGGSEVYLMAAWADGQVIRFNPRT